MKNQLNALAAALAMGIFWGLALFASTLISIKTGFGVQFLNLFTDVYPHYALTNTGALWGLVWGVVDGFIGAYVFVWIYNFFIKKLGK